MVEHECGEVPVVKSKDPVKLVGIVTDRDIAYPPVATGKNPPEMTAGECVTSPCVTVTPETSVEDCCRRCEGHQVRRVPAVHERGRR